MAGEDPKLIAAEVAKQILDNQGTLTKSFGEIREEVRIMGERMKKAGFDGELDLNEIRKSYEETRARLEGLMKQIKRVSAETHGIVGAEDENKFSLARALVAIKTGRWDHAGVEKELIDQAAKKAIQIADWGKAGGYFLPNLVLAEVIAMIYARSVLVNYNAGGNGDTRISVINGIPAETGSIRKVKGGVTSYWVGEEDAIARSAMSVGDLSWKLRTLANLIGMTQKMIDFGGAGFDGFVHKDMIQSMTLKLDLTGLYGKGTDNMPRGVASLSGTKKFSAITRDVVTAATGPGAAQNVGGNLDFDGLDFMKLLVEEGNFAEGPSAAFIGCPRFFTRLKQIKVENYSAQTGQKDYLLGLPRLPDARLREIIGDFGKSTQIPTNRLPGQSAGWTTNSTETKFSDVFYSPNWNDMVLVAGPGLRVESDDGKGDGFASNVTFMKAFGYFDYIYRYPESIVHCPDARVFD